MPDRLPRGLRALYALVRFGAVEPHRPADVIDRLCEELELCFDLVGVRSLSPDSDLGHAAVADGRAIAASDQVVVPLLAQGRVLGCVRGQLVSASAKVDLDLLSTIGHVAAVLVQKAERDEELDLVLRQLRRADRAKTEFVSTAAHELRGPVAIVGGIASTLDSRGEELEPDQLRQLHNLLHEQSIRLRDLIEQLLDLSRIESGTISVQRQPIALREWLELLLLRLVPDSLAEIEVCVDPAVEIETDGYAFERVVGNLIVNALRHGQPPVRVRSRIGESVCLCVEDSGYGVPPDFVPQLFERFSRSAVSRRSETNGVGLGLSIARSYAEALGASLYYESAEPRGARFVVELHDVTPAPQHRSTSPARSG